MSYQLLMSKPTVYETIFLSSHAQCLVDKGNHVTEHSLV